MLFEGTFGRFQKKKKFGENNSTKHQIKFVTVQKNRQVIREN